MTIEIKIHNVETGEIVQREMTETELAQREASQIAEETIKAAEAARAHERAALLERLGITEDEAKLLFS
jgi:hypothetical protein